MFRIAAWNGFNPLFIGSAKNAWYP